MAAIDKVVFARACVRHANFCGINSHYMVSVAQLRSGIVDDSAPDGVGPFRFTQQLWDANRQDPEFTPDFDSGDIIDWHMQCAVFARMVHHALDALVTASGGAMPSALDLYIAQLAAAGEAVAPADLTELEADVGAALAATAEAVRRAEAETLADGSQPAGPEPARGLLLFRRAPGRAFVQGHLVARMQDALITRGHMPRVDANGQPNDDGLFGPDTEAALEAWQTASGFLSTGALTVEQWRELTATPPPDIFDLCAQLTAAFEGTGFGGTNETDFDGQVLTFGYHGLTLKDGGLLAFLHELDAAQPALLGGAFGDAMAASLRGLMAAKPAQAVSRGRQLFLTGGRVKEEWRAAFAQLGQAPACQAAQLAWSRKEYWTGSGRVREILGVSEPLSQALCFDVAVQNGDKSAIARTLRAGFGATTGELERRLAYGNAIADAAKAQFRADVRKRKVDTLCDGDGSVHGARYVLADWGFAAPDSAELDDHPRDVSPPPANAPFDVWFRQALPDVTAFSPAEFLVKGRQNASNHLNTDPPRALWPNIVKTVRVLVELKRRLGGAAITLNSAYRSRAYNESVGGARDSQHMKFSATDIVVHDGQRPADWARALHGMRGEGLFAGGIGLYPGFVHVDTRGFNANWG